MQLVLHRLFARNGEINSSVVDRCINAAVVIDNIRSMDHATRRQLFEKAEKRFDQAHVDDVRMLLCLPRLGSETQPKFLESIDGRLVTSKDNAVFENAFFLWLQTEVGLLSS